MKKLTLIFLLLISFRSYGQNNPNAAAEKEAEQTSGIAVYPARVAYNLDRGATGKKTITVKNATKKKQRLLVDLVDWSRDTLGEHEYYVPGTMPFSCAKWVTFDKPLIELEPGQSTDVTVTMRVPDSAEAVKEMKWTMLVVKAVSEKALPGSSKTLGARVEQSIGMGVHIYEVPPSVTSKELKMTSFGPLPGHRNTLRIACKNVGALQLYGKFTVELSSNTGEKTALEAQVVPMFPQQDRYVDFVLPTSLAKGKYTAVALIDANDEEVPIEAAQKEITVQ